MTGVRDTSIESYRDITDSGYLSASEAEVNDWFHTNPQSTDKEISILSGLDINVVTARRNDLVQKGIIREAGKRECSITGKIVLTWEPGKQEQPQPECLTASQLTNVQKRILLANQYQLNLIKNLVLHRLEQWP